MQVCHGRSGPLRRIGPGDRVAYYSPTATFRGRDTLQAFTAIGMVRAGEPYRFDTDGGFCGFRRDVDWETADDAPIQPLLDRLAFAAGKRNWGHALRYGLLPVPAHDFGLIAEAMGAASLATAARAGGPAAQDRRRNPAAPVYAVLVKSRA